jgi:hypothetical protein
MAAQQRYRYQYGQHHIHSVLKFITSSASALLAALQWQQS